MKYFLKRIVMWVPTFLIITFLYFALIHLLPGGPVQEALRQMNDMGQSFTPEARAQLEVQLRERYQLNDPLGIRYLSWLKNFLGFQWGDSIQGRGSILTLIIRALSYTGILGFWTLILTFMGSLVSGVFLQSIHRRFHHQKILEGIKFLFLIPSAIPSMVTGALLILIFATDQGFSMFPLGGFMGDVEGVERYTRWVLPILSMSLGLISMYTFYFWDAYQETFQEPHIQASLARGISDFGISFRHAMKPTLLVFLGSFGNFMMFLVSGSVLIEYQFNIPGIGSLFMNALQSRDYPVLLCIGALQTLALLLGRAAVDGMALRLDPRIRMGEGIEK